MKAIRALPYQEVIPNLRSIVNKGRPKTNCPKWFSQGLEQADLAYEINTGWKLTNRGMSLLAEMGHLA